MALCDNTAKVCKPTSAAKVAKYDKETNTNKYKCDEQLQNGKMNGFPNPKYKYNIITYMETTMETAFFNNIWMNGYKRLRKYFYHKIKEFRLPPNQIEITEKDVYKTLDSLFVRKSKHAPNEYLLSFMQDDLMYDLEGFYVIDDRKKYFRYIPFFYRLQRYNEAEQIQNFALILTFKHGRKHITIDSNALFCLLQTIHFGFRMETL